MHSSRHAARLAGCSMRQLDYLVRTGLLHPAVGPNGIGSRMRWSDGDVAVLAVFTVLRQLGATHLALAGLENALRALDAGGWSDRHVLTPEGSLVALSSASGGFVAGWLVDLSAISVAESVAA